MNKFKNNHIWVVLGVILLIVLGSIYCYKWYKVKQAEKYYTSYLVDTNTINFEINNLDEMTNVLSETANYYFVYISYTQDEDVYHLEKELKPLIDEYNLANNFYYVNVTEIKNTYPNYLSDIAIALNINKDNLKNIPIILYFKDKVLQTEGVSTAKDFKDLLDKYNIKNM